MPFSRFTNSCMSKLFDRLLPNSFSLPYHAGPCVAKMAISSQATLMVYPVYKAFLLSFYSLLEVDNTIIMVTTLIALNTEKNSQMGILLTTCTRYALLALWLSM